MICFPKGADNSVVIDAIHNWLIMLVNREYNKAFESVGYLVSFDKDGADCIQQAIENYRNDEIYPNVTEFKVTDWKKAVGGNPNPVHSVNWYLPNSVGCAGAVIFDLPLNEKWSDLQADFVILDAGDHYSLMLEEISKSI